jgi:hypothetical protein
MPHSQPLTNFGGLSQEQDRQRELKPQLNPRTLSTRGSANADSLAAGANTKRNYELRIILIYRLIISLCGTFFVKIKVELWYECAIHC